MYKSKISPEEALELIKVRMNYDTKKTLKENKGTNIINEQDKSNFLTDQDLLGATGLLRQYFQQVTDYNLLYRPLGLNVTNLLAGKRKGVKGVVDALDGIVQVDDLAYVLQTIKSLGGKCYYDEIEGKNISATQAFLDLYQEDEGEDLKSDVESVGTATLTTGSEKIKKMIIKLIDVQVAQGCPSQKKEEDKKTDGSVTPRQQNVNNTYCSVKNGKITAGGINNGVEWEKYKTTWKVTDAELEAAKKSCPKNNSNSGGGSGGNKSRKVPSELATVDGIKAFQDWLDKNHPNWATGYKDGIINKGANGGGYGSFGPRTSNAWTKYKNDYLSGKTNKQDDEEVVISGEGGVNEPMD